MQKVKIQIIVGKFQPLTNGHLEIYNNLSKNGLETIFVIVRSKSRKNLYLSDELTEKCFEGFKFIVYETGYLVGIIEKLNELNYEPVILSCGSDRLESYNLLIENNNLSLYLIEQKRDENAISSTKIRENIKNKDYFIANTPECIHKYYDEILKELTA